jgi:hypothetical protein
MPSALAKPSQTQILDHSGRPLVREQTRADAWENHATGFGTRRDKTTYGRFSAGVLLTDQQCSDLFHHSDMPRRIVEALPHEMLREPFEVSVGDQDADETIAERLEQLDVRAKFREAMVWGRLYGGAAILLVPSDDRFPSWSPLVPENESSLESLSRIHGPGEHAVVPEHDRRADAGRPPVHRELRLGRHRPDAPDQPHRPPEQVLPVRELNAVLGDDPDYRPRLFLSNNPGISVVPWPRCNLAGTGGTKDRIVAYNNSPNVLEAVVPQEYEEQAPQQVEHDFVIPAAMRCGGIKIYRPLNVRYADVNPAT